MAKTVSNRLSMEEWAQLPITFGGDAVAKVLGVNLRYVQNHAEELGGVKLGGKWLFSKPRVAALVGITEVD